MVSRVRLVKGLCIAVVTLLMAGNAVAGIHGAAREIQDDIAGQDPNNEDIRAITRATSAILNDDLQQISDARANQDMELERLARSMRTNYFTILDKVAGRPSPVIATVAALREDQTRQRDRITEILGHRAQ